MSEIKRILRLTKQINTELQHFVPCVNSEIEAKTSICKYLREIRTLAQDIHSEDHLQCKPEFTNAAFHSVQNKQWGSFCN